jgi:hypothetical protein
MKYVFNKVKAFLLRRRFERVLAAGIILAATSCSALVMGAETVSVPIENPGDGKMKQTHYDSVPPFKASYAVEDDAIVSHNGARFFNRPLYAPNIPAMAFAGDKPQLRLIDAEYCYGTLLLGYARGESSKWLHEFGTITTRFYPARVVWEMSDSSIEGVRIRCEAAAFAVGNGMTLKFSVEGAQTGDKVVWAFGGGTPKRPDSGVPTLIWELDPSFQPAQTIKGLTPELCAGNRVQASGEAFVLTPPLSKGYPDQATYALGSPSERSAFGSCSEKSNPSVGDANALGLPLALIRSKASDLPMVYGKFSATEAGGPVYWAIQAEKTDQAESFLRSGKGLSNLPALHEQAVKRAFDFANRVVIDTPDPALDTAVAFQAAALDGAWYPPYYTHGAMVWNGPMPGWRRLYGPTVYGWHENVKTEMKYYLKSQVRESGYTRPLADPNYGLTLQAPNSRFLGKGRITAHHSFCYDMQSVWFDTLIYAWRWTGDAELEALLRPALELHLEWQRDCFDPDGNGLYESYANAWATDSAWYNGGEGNQTTGYAYRGYLAAADMARRGGDTEIERRHRSRAELIRRNMRILWMESEGCPAEYREALGYRRLHPEPCLYSIFLPIDADLFNRVETVQALNYTEWGLQRDVSPLGGELCWTSNWVPWHWSLRELYPGENYHLALAYYQTGMAADGWKLLMGNYREGLYNSVVPGAVSHKSCGTDFSDSSTMFCRLIVEGLFGYVPDRPNSLVVFRPQFPQDWDYASIRTPDFEFKYQRATESLTWRVTMVQPAPMEFRIPVSAKSVRTVTVNGVPAKWRTEAGFGRSVIVVRGPAGREAEVCVKWEGGIPSDPSQPVAAAVGQSVELRVPQGEIVEVIDPTGLLRDMLIDGAMVRATVMHAGNVVVMARVKTGDLEQWHIFKMKVKDPYAEAQKSAQTLAAPPADASWNPINLSGVLNCDVRDVYKQKYLTPRVQTCSTQLATDGFSPWTFTLWQCKPPLIDLSKVPGLLGEKGLLQTPQGVPFLWPGDGKNIAFTTQYDNFPNAVRVPVGRSGRAAWFLVAGTTNPFQTKIANAVLRLRYADGVEEALELVPPQNYWMVSDKEWYYRKDVDAFCLPKVDPPMVQLGNECRAMVLNRVMRPGVVLESVELETLSQEVVVGLMGLTIMN